jgi:hypothetical protein
MMINGTFEKLQSGRYFIAVSLLEAEHLRGLIHQRRGKWLLEGAQAAIGLRVGSLLLDASQGYVSANDYQSTTAQQAFRFLNSDMYFEERELNMILRGLQKNVCELRRDWYLEVRSCRRRSQRDFNKISLVRVFTMKDQYQLLEYRALVVRVRALIIRRGMLCDDAFQAFDDDRDGQLSCSELYGGITWLGLECTESDIHTLVRNIDTHNNGTISSEDFARAFYIDPKTMTEPVSEELHNVHVPPRKMQELILSHAKEYKEYKAGNVPVTVLSKCQISLKKPKALSLVWNTTGGTSRDPASVWAPSEDGGVLSSRNKQSVAIGHYATADLKSPLGDTKFTPWMIRIADNSSSGMFNRLQKSSMMPSIISTYFPFPKKYTQVWSTIQTETPLYVWVPVPPTKDFVALGVVCTTTPDEPDQDLVHCVPKRFCVPARSVPTKIWDNSGLGGKKGSFWAHNSLNLFQGLPAHLCPENHGWWELFKTEFQMTESAPVQAEQH